MALHIFPCVPSKSGRQHTEFTNTTTLHGRQKQICHLQPGEGLLPRHWTKLHPFDVTPGPHELLEGKKMSVGQPFGPSLQLSSCVIQFVSTAHSVQSPKKPRREQVQRADFFLGGHRCRRRRKGRTHSRCVVRTQLSQGASTTQHPAQHSTAQRSA